MAPWRKHHLALLGVAGAAIAGGLVFHCRGNSPHLSTAPAAAADARFAPLPRGVAATTARLAWADATRYEYDLSWSSRQESRLATDSGARADAERQRRARRDPGRSCRRSGAGGHPAGGRARGRRARRNRGWVQTAGLCMEDDTCTVGDVNGDHLADVVTFKHD